MSMLARFARALDLSEDEASEEISSGRRAQRVLSRRGLLLGAAVVAAQAALPPVRAYSIGSLGNERRDLVWRVSDDDYRLMLFYRVLFPFTAPEYP